MADGKGVTREERKVLAATLVGTAIEWYDYFIYAQAAGLVLGPLFFGRLQRITPHLLKYFRLRRSAYHSSSARSARSFAVTLDDRLGRKVVLVMTLILMGASTVLIGLL